eukprot:1138382-Pelagomonas_calceolata.AAC.14
MDAFGRAVLWIPLAGLCLPHALRLKVPDHRHALLGSTVHNCVNRHKNRTEGSRKASRTEQKNYVKGKNCAKEKNCVGPNSPWSSMKEKECVQARQAWRDVCVQARQGWQDVCVQARQGWRDVCVQARQGWQDVCVQARQAWQDVCGLLAAALDRGVSRVGGRERV